MTTVFDHFVLTRSAYGPAWDLAANRRRLAMFRGVTARLMERQTDRRFVWVVLLDAADPLRAERAAVVAAAGVPYRILAWDSSSIVPTQAPWDKAKSTTLVQRIAATAYRAPWGDAMRGDRPRLITRIDDDDGFALDALARVRRRAELDGVEGRVAWMLPMGVRVWAGREAIVRHPTNAMHTLQVPAGDRATVYDYGHRRVEGFCPVRIVDEEPGWLWVRHRDSISGHRVADRPVTGRTRRLFPIDWRLVR